MRERWARIVGGAGLIGLGVWLASTVVTTGPSLVAVAALASGVIGAATLWMGLTYTWPKN